MDVALEGVVVVRGGRTVLDVPSLGFPAGSTTAVFGPNGSGKTTLLRLVAGLERTSRGRVRIGALSPGPNGGSPPPTAIAFQEQVFVAGSVRRNLELALELRRVAPADRATRIAEAAAECGIEAVLDRPARQLSGGEAQRVNLARALALRAPVTLLDEPLSGIDRPSRAQLLDDLPRLLGTFATTTILVTHDREEAFRLARQLVVLVGGVVRAAGPAGAVFRAPPDRTVAELLGHTVLRSGAGLLAVPPGGLRLGHGQGNPTFTLEIERIVDMGNHPHLVGRVGDVRVDLRLDAGEVLPSPGEFVRVTAPAAVVLPRPD
ncbi:MAG: ATP-binding cassette domain-containing protein [Gemmatimonadales bacterium]|nr:ATP-binding cassette domain-containing protein [Gemmatimonadales bacterium]